MAQNVFKIVLFNFCIQIVHYFNFKHGILYYYKFVHIFFIQIKNKKKLIRTSKFNSLKYQNLTSA